MPEACRIVVTQEVSGLVSVSAPMRYKSLCYDILRDAKRVIELTSDVHFFNPGRTLIITMNTSGLVDVAAPLPPREWCEMALKAARLIIEQFEERGIPTQAGHADCLPSP